MINVSCALIINENKEVLAAQRSAQMKLPLKWEFPGGKIEPEESAEDCLIREIKEELAVEIMIIDTLTPIEYDYEEFRIQLIPFVCTIQSGKVKLTEHTNYLWLQPNQLLTLDWAEADIPIVMEYLKLET